MDSAQACVLALILMSAVLLSSAQSTMEEPLEARRTKPSTAADFADAFLRGAAGSSTAAGLGAGLLRALAARNYKKMAQTILPLLVGFKATGMLVIAIAVTKFVLLKALFLSTTALLVAGLVALKKFLTSAGQPHDIGGAYTYQQHDLSHVPYLHPHTAAEYMEASQMPVPQVTYIGGSYGLQSVPYAATAAAGLGAAGLGAGLGAAGEDAQGLYSSHSNTVALSQLQQLQQLHQHALLAQQLGNATSQQQQHQAGHALQLSRRRLSAHPGATVSSPYPYRPSRTEAIPA